jgi:CheB methylesterase
MAGLLAKHTEMGVAQVEDGMTIRGNSVYTIPPNKFLFLKESQELSREQKIEILRQWEQDARLMEVAEEENMPGPQPKLLQPIRDALHALNYWPDTEHSSPSKA